MADQKSAVCIQWPATGRTQWVGKVSFDNELKAAGWVLVDPQPKRPGVEAKAKPPATKAARSKAKS